jgi:ATP-binding cassette subfamily B protein
MDEPTASLDPISEYMVFNEFISANTSDMKIIVSHRVGITSKADKILMFKNGELIEYGDHKTLIDNNGDYAELYRTQAEWYNVESKKTLSTFDSMSAEADEARVQF